MFINLASTAQLTRVWGLKARAASLGDVAGVVVGGWGA